MKIAILMSAVLSQLSFLVLVPVYIKLFSYLHPIVILIVWFCQTLLISFIVFGVKRIKIQIRSTLFNWILILYSFGLIMLLFFRPSDQNYHTWNLTPFSTISFYLNGDINPLVAFYNLAANIGLFIPFGIFILLHIRTAQALVLIPCAGIAAIEITQFLTKRGSLDIDDIILNLLGVFIGYLLYPVFRKVITIK
jgi:glycopeptide antibiotics resistance protein